MLALNNKSIHAPFLLAMLADLTTLRYSGRLLKSNLTQSDIFQAARIFDQLCRIEQGLEAPKEAAPTMRLLEQLKSFATNAFGDETGVDKHSFAVLTMLAFLVAMLTGLIVILARAYRFFYSLAANRRSCRIPALFIFRDIEIVGHVTILGTVGARFIPDTGDNTSRLVEVLKQQSRLPTVMLKFEDSAFAAKPHFITKDFFAALFLERLERQTLKNLYGHSLVPAQYLPKKVVKSNMRDINPKFA
jgi:hypothetical protein